MSIPHIPLDYGQLISADPPPIDAQVIRGRNRPLERDVLTVFATSDRWVANGTDFWLREGPRTGIDPLENFVNGRVAPLAARE
jgi:hypothetical protein